MPEIAGKAALLVNPASVPEIANALQRIVTDVSLCAQMRKSGLVRATEFSWGKTASRIVSLLEK
jgi:glycosyltransferase involved in cell wall biosynthesis